MQSLELDQQQPLPLVVRGWSKAKNVSGSADSNYSLYVDLTYADGTPLWGQTAEFRCGTHDWERKELIILPEKPVKRLSVYCLFRGQHTGTVWFDDVSLEEVHLTAGAWLYQGAMVQNPESLPALSKESSRYLTTDGLGLAISNQAQLIAGDLPLNVTGAFGGFLARDVAGNSSFYGFENGVCRELNLRVQYKVQTRPDHLVIEGRVSDTSGRDRAITLVFALPVDATGWQWWDDINTSRIIKPGVDYANPVRVRCGATGTQALYPVAAISDERNGFSLALDMGCPAVHRLGYHAGLRQLYAAFDFGLVPDTQLSPSAANFRLVLYRFTPTWGFRSAWDKFMRIFPEYFVVRAKDQGLWMPFTDISTVQDWQDFGFKFHEGNNNVAFDDAHNILSFRYTEPMTWWMTMKKDLPRSPETALKVRVEILADPKHSQHKMAQASVIAEMWDGAGQPCLKFQDTPWCNGAVWSLNPNPHLPGDLNFATAHWNTQIKDKLYGPSTKAQLDGEYLDSLEGYVTADLNFRREHFRFSTVPLGFETETGRPALTKGLAVYEFTRWICDEVHHLGRLTFANSVPYRFTYLCPWLDVMGTETDWLRQGKYQPASPAQMNLWRTLSGRKPYLLLMNTDYDQLKPELVELYFQRSLALGLFPGMFSHNAADNPYWKNPAWYNRDRPLFKKYIPLIKKIAEAGWEPVTGVRSDQATVTLERFGAPGKGIVYLTVYNHFSQPQMARLRLDPQELGKSARLETTDLLRGRSFPTMAQTVEITLDPQQAAVLTIHQ